MNTRIHSTRLIRATPEAVYEAFRQPERLARWWGPAGFTNTFHEFDFREGGNWTLDMRGPDEQVFPNESRFLEIVPAKKIVIEHLRPVHHFLLTVSLNDEYGHTHVDWEMVFDSPEEREKVLPYVPRCNEENFDRLEAELSRDAEADVRKAIRDWHAALERRDLESMIAAYAPDAVLFDVKPPWQIAGRAAIRKVWEDCLPFFPKRFRIETRDLRVHVNGDMAVAHWIHRLIADEEPDHPAAQTCLRGTVVMRRIDDRWMSVHDHVSVPFDPMTGRPDFTLDPDGGSGS